LGNGLMGGAASFLGAGTDTGYCPNNYFIPVANTV
jgi:hypothetical protein